MNILIVTPRLRSYGRAITSAARARHAWGQPHTLVEFQHDNPHPEGNVNILTLYNRARALFLAGAWDAMLTLEDDMVVPPDAIGRLAQCLEDGADVAYSLYCWRYGPPHKWSAYRYVWPDSGESWSNAQPQTAAGWLTAGAVVPVQGLGLGCTLIRRRVLERLPFRLGDGGAANDWYFAVDCQAAGYAAVCDFGVVCGHIRLDPSARVIWPEVDAGGHAGWRYERFEVAA